MAKRFDDLAKALANGVSRRQALKVLGGSILGTLFAGKAVEEAGAFTYTNRQKATACKAYCRNTFPGAGGNYSTCYSNCLACQGDTRTNNPGGPSNMCANFADGTNSSDGSSTMDPDNDGDPNGLFCCRSGNPCNPNTRTCQQCRTGQIPCGTSCCPPNSTCATVSGTPTCIVRCTTVICGKTCCPSGYVCGSVSGIPTCTRAGSVSGHKRKHHKHA